MKRVFAILLTAVCTAVGVSQASAADVLAELYGQGVHAYFSGNLDLAEQYLNQAIDSGSRDPRAYYFRGLTQARRAGEGAGEADFQQGAELESSARSAKPSDEISKSLTRVQGRNRLAIEKARSAARLAAKLQQAALKEAAQMMDPAAGGAQVPAADPSSVTEGLMQGQAKEMPNKPAVPEVVPSPAGENVPAPDKTVDPFKDDTPAPADAPKTPTEDPFGGNPFGN